MSPLSLIVACVEAFIHAVCRPWVRTPTRENAFSRASAEADAGFGEAFQQSLRERRMSGALRSPGVVGGFAGRSRVGDEKAGLARAVGFVRIDERCALDIEHAHGRAVGLFHRAFAIGRVAAGVVEEDGLLRIQAHFGQDLIDLAKTLRLAALIDPGVDREHVVALFVVGLRGQLHAMPGVEEERDVGLLLAVSDASRSPLNFWKQSSSDFSVASTAR